MKLITFLILVSFSFNIFAVSIDTAGLTNAEIQAVDESTDAQLNDLHDCVIEQNETMINETSCLNEVLGDVHN
jgi:hypothetical protein